MEKIVISFKIKYFLSIDVFFLKLKNSLGYKKRFNIEFLGYLEIFSLNICLTI